MKKVLLWIVAISLLLFLVGGCTAPSAPIASPTPTASYVSPSAPTAPSMPTPEPTAIQTPDNPSTGSSASITAIGRLLVRAKTTDGHPLAGASIRVSYANRDIASGTTDANGTISFELTAVDYQVMMSFNGVEKNLGTFKVRPGETTEID